MWSSRSRGARRMACTATSPRCDPVMVTVPEKFLRRSSTARPDGRGPVDALGFLPLRERRAGERQDAGQCKYWNLGHFHR